MMNEQQKNEVIKALAYGKTPEEIVEAADVTLEEVSEVAMTCAEEITEFRDAFKNGGLINEYD